MLRAGTAIHGSLIALAALSFTGARVTGQTQVPIQQTTGQQTTAAVAADELPDSPGVSRLMIESSSLPPAVNGAASSNGRITRWFFRAWTITLVSSRLLAGTTVVSAGSELETSSDGEALVAMTGLVASSGLVAMSAPGESGSSSAATAAVVC